VLVAFAVVVSVAACGSDDTGSSGPSASDGIRVGSFDFAESVLLAEMYAQVIESTGTPVVRVGTVGPREIMAPALELGHIDVVPEYLGTALSYAGATEPNPDSESALADLDGRLSEIGLTALDAAPAEDKNVFVVTKELAETESLVTISDLGGLAPSLRFGGPPECQGRPLCYAGLQSVYGLRFDEFVPQRTLPFTAEALRRGEIDVGLLFSTSAPLLMTDLVELVDDREMQPAENIVPVVRVEALERWGPEVAAALNRLSAKLTTLELRILNVQVADEQPVADAARRWLEAHDVVRSS
jgi:osmoprotectant transport system substrate-binding protein